MSNLPLPGMAAISLWMLALAVLGTVGVLTHHYPPFVLTLCTALAAAGLGLIRLRRWGWALSLGAVFLSMCFGCYSVFRFHQTQWLVMAVINLVFFLYLVRPEVIGRLRRGA
jgi:uncharacterized membrane protein (DUF2068 family)